MADQRRFFWLKLKEDFFRQKEIKKLRGLAGGDTFTIIYLKMLLRSLKNDGRLYYDGIEDDFPSELALDIDEDEDNVKVTVAFLMSKGILIQNRPDEYEIVTASEMTDSECESASRVRRHRANRALEEPAQPLLCNADVTASNSSVTTSNVEIDIERRDRVRDRDRDKEKRKRFTPPTLDEVKAYASEKGWTDADFNPERFIDFYASKGWKVGRDPMKDWKASARGWVARNSERQVQAVRTNPANNYQQRDYSQIDESSFFIDLEKEFGGE